MLSASDLEFQAALAGRYFLDREIGRGGMGIVYLAREAVLDRAVAIKRLPPEFASDPDARERFVREAKTAAQLFHPNIVPIHCVDSVGPFVFFAMGYVDGSTVGQLVRRRGPLPVADAARILRDVAWALGYGHARGVVHRDVKPDNLLVEKESGRTLVSDFGIAQQDGASALTRDGQLLGSVHYMSPEHIAGNQVTARSDVYALGAVAHFLLTGRPPFDSPATTAVLAKHLNEPAPPIASVASGVPAPLASAIDRCLAKDPAARFPNANAFAEALADIAPRQPIPAILRGWIKGAGLVDPGFVVVGFMTFAFIVKTQNFWLLGAPLGYALMQRLRATRRVIAGGYDAGDLSAMLLAEIERRSEESAAYFDRPKPSYLKTLRAVSTAAVMIAVGTFGFLSWVEAKGRAWYGAHVIPGWDWYYSLELLIGVCMLVVVGATIVTESVAPSRFLERLGSADLSWRFRFWRSKAGAFLAKVLRRGASDDLSADTDRPTEVLVGAAAASLFQALPRGVQKEFAELPRVVRQLETRARELRARRKQMELFATDAARPVGAAREQPGVERLRADTVEELGAARSAVERKLATTIAALETIRLDLLRLHAGRGSTADLTAALNAATSIGDDVSATLAGRASVERLLAGQVSP